MKRRILILPSWYPSDASPVFGIFVQDQALALSREYDVAIMVPGLVSWRDVMRGKVGPKSQVEQRMGLRVYRQHVLVPTRRVPMLAYASYVRAAKLGFEAMLTTWGKPDIIHAHVVLPAGWAAVRLGRLYSTPVVLTEHSGPFSMHLGTEYGRRLVRQTLKRANRVIAVSPALTQQVLAFQNGIEITVVGELVRSDFFVPSNHERRCSNPITRFLCIALLTEGKGLVYLLEAIRLLVKRGITSFDVVVGGDGPERARLERMTQSLGLSDWCHFLGLLDRSEVRYLMQQCDAFVLPSLGETFGIVLGEAMACGKPVIATRCGGPGFVVTPDTGILVDVADSEALADAMSDFIMARLKFDPEVARRSVVVRFGEEAFLRNMSAVYEHVWSKI